MEINFTIIALTALIPLAVGFVWYHPKVFGTAWIKATGLSEEQTKDMNMLKVFGLTYVFSLFVAMVLQSIVIHQYSVYGILINEPGFGESGSEVMNMLDSFMAKYGNNFRTFKHGAFHGALTGLFLAMPVIAINSLFERKNFSYIAINTGFWMLCLALMGGVICAMG